MDKENEGRRIDNNNVDVVDDEDAKGLDDDI